MDLGYIERGTTLKIFEEFENRAVSDEFEGTFRYFEDELFAINCPGLYEYYDKLRPDACLHVSFLTETNIHSLTGNIVEKQRTPGMILMKQLTDIVTTNRRQYDRDELRVKISIFGLSVKNLDEMRFDRPETEPDMLDMTYDISAGGVCVISNILLNSKHDPYYLIEFSLSPLDSFLLPAQLVRRSNYPRTKIGRYDYGFQFIFDNLPEEKGKLSRAILSRKLSFR